MRDLEKANRLLFAYRPTLSFLKVAAQGMDSFRLIDIGSGHGDGLRAIARWAERRGISVELTGLDLSPAATSAAIVATPAELPIRYLTGNVFEHVSDPAPDFVVSSLFAHHLDDRDVIRFVHWMENHALGGWHISDLHRHPAAWAGFRALAMVMRWHPVVRHDGAISVRRGFTRGDWERVLQETGIDGAARIRWWLPFRFSVNRVVR
jgi:hypothetical protein